MKLRFLALLLFVTVLSYSMGETRTEAEVAQQYVKWARQAIDEGRWPEALAALERAADFSPVSSDISYLLALARSHERKSRVAVLEALHSAFKTDLWFYYSASQARFLQAEQFVKMRNYHEALSALDLVSQSADSAELRLLALRGLATDPAFGPDNVSALAQFRRSTLEAMDRYSRDPRPLKIFFEYARNRNPAPSSLEESDLNLMALALRRLPALIETEPELAWLASPFIRDAAQARRLVASYRTGALYSDNVKNFRPNPGSIAAALNLGLLNDSEAVEEFFNGPKVFDNRPGLFGGVGFAPDGEIRLDKDLIAEIGNLLRSDEGRNLFARRLLSFSGVITGGRDSYFETCAFYRGGALREYAHDADHDGLVDYRVIFGADSTPLRAELTENRAEAQVFWEQYPSVHRADLAGSRYFFRPADFQYSPLNFIELGASKNYSGLIYPVIIDQNFRISRRSLVSFCAGIQRPSVEFDGAVEQFDLERGIPLRAVETLKGQPVSRTGFENGYPVIQYIDLDLDGRMETVRRFRKPVDPDYGFLDYRSLIYSSRSDWAGEENISTGEMYREDGSVVFSWDWE